MGCDAAWVQALASCRGRRLNPDFSNYGGAPSRQEACSAGDDRQAYRDYGCGLRRPERAYSRDPKGGATVTTRVVQPLDRIADSPLAAFLSLPQIPPRVAPPILRQ